MASSTALFIYDLVIQRKTSYWLQALQKVYSTPKFSYPTPTLKTKNGLNLLAFEKKMV